MPEIPFLSDEQGQDRFLPINLYYEPMTDRGLPALVGRPGTKLNKDIGNTGHKGIRDLKYDPNNQYVYALTNDGLYYATLAEAVKLASAGTWTKASDAGAASLADYYGNMAVGKDHIFISCGTTQAVVAKSGWAVTGTLGVASTRPAPTTYQDGYYIIGRRTDAGALTENTRRFMVSGVNDPISWTSTNWGEINAYNDQIVNLVSHNRTIYIFGENTIEFWRNTGQTGGVPFSRVQGTTIRGTGLPLDQFHTVCPVGDSLFFVNSNYQVCMFQTYTPVRISTPVVERTIKDDTLAAVTAMYGMAISMRGRLWYMLACPASSCNLVYDLATQRWFKWSHSATSSSAEWKVRCSCVTPYGTLFGTQSGFTNAEEHILSLDEDAGNDYAGNASDTQLTYRQHIAPPIVHDSITAHSRLELRSKEPDSAVSVTLSHSNDGGDSWTSDSAVSSATGIHSWYRLGATKRRQYKIESTTNIAEHEYYGAYVDAKPGIP